MESGEPLWDYRTMTRTAALNSIYELAKIDERVVFVGSDLAPNTLADFKRDFPDRYFMEGVAEQNIIGMAAGLALEGYIPFVNTIATFLTRRCYEQIVIDICAHNLPVRLLGNGGGLVYAPLGLTHIAIDDLAIMRAIPNMTVHCCSDSEEMKTFMQSTLTNPSPMYIRLGKDTDPILPYAEKLHYNFSSIPNILFISTGIMSNKCLEVIEKLDVLCDFIHVRQIKPFDVKIKPIYKMVVVAEEGIINGGLGSAVLEHLADNNIQMPVLRFGIPDAFPHHYGEQADLLETYGLTVDAMTKRINEFYARI